MENDEDKNYNEAVRWSIEEAKILEAKKISRAEANSLIDHRHNVAMTAAEEDVQLARALAKSIISDDHASAAAAGGHHHKRPVNHAEEEAYINMAQMRSLNDAESGAAAAGGGHKHIVAKNDADEHAQLEQALALSRPITFKGSEIIEAINKASSDYYRVGPVPYSVDEARGFFSSEERCTFEDIRDILDPISAIEPYSSEPQIAGFLKFFYDSIHLHM